MVPFNFLPSKGSVFPKENWLTFQILHGQFYVFLSHSQQQHTKAGFSLQGVRRARVSNVFPCHILSRLHSKGVRVPERERLSQPVLVDSGQ